MPILATDIASIKGVGTIEKQFAPVAVNLTPRIALVGSYDNTKTAVVPDVPVKIISALDAGTRFGFGTQLHRQAVMAFKGHGGAIETYAVPVADANGAAASAGTLVFATNASSAGTYTIYCGSRLAEDVVSVSVVSGATPTEIGELVEAAINANTSLPFTANNTAGSVSLTCKTKGTVGNLYIVAVDTSAAPTGTTLVVTTPVTGSGSAVMSGALAGIHNTSLWFTDVIATEYSTTNTALALSVIGNPNEKTGWYDSQDCRPANVWFTGVTGGSAGLSAAIVVGTAQKSNPDILYVQAPSYNEEPSEISTYLSSVACLNVAQNPAREITRVSLPYLAGPIVAADDWTSEYANRNSALVAGLAIVRVDGGVVKFGDMATTWHPADNQNAGFKYYINQRKIWNVAKSIKDSDAADSYQDRPIVSSVANTLNVSAIDEDIIRANLVALAYQWQQRAWIYDAGFTINNMTVTKNISNPDRFDKVIPIILSGNNRVEDTEIQIDRNTSLSATVEVS